MKTQLTKNLMKKPAVDQEQDKGPVQIETVKLAKVKTGVMAGICCTHDSRC